jgi:hypothetical protein
MKSYEARNSYKSAVEMLVKYCDEKTDLSPVIVDPEYPFRVRFFPDTQTSMFDDENVDENGEVNYLEVTVGLTTTIKSTLKFKLDAKLFKKLVKLAETAGNLYYQAFREEAGALAQDGGADE